MGHPVVSAGDNLWKSDKCEDWGVGTLQVGPQPEESQICLLKCFVEFLLFTLEVGRADKQP